MHNGPLCMHNGPLYLELAPYGVFLAGSEHANCLHRTMHISYFKLCHLQARTLKDAGRPQSTDTIPQTSREILHTMGRRSMVEGLTIWESIMHTCLPYLPYETLEICLGSTYQFMYFNIPPWDSIYKLYIYVFILYIRMYCCC